MYFMVMMEHKSYEEMKPVKAGTHQAGRQRTAVGLVCLVCSTRRLASAAVCPIQHVESASGPSARVRTLIGCSVKAWNTLHILP